MRNLLCGQSGGHTMTAVTIKATKHGFHSESGIGSALSPDAFLLAGLDREGSFIFTDGGDGFVFDETLGSDSVLIIADIQGGLPVPGEPGDVSEITVTGLSYYRIEDGVLVKIGTLTLPEPITVEAMFDSLNGTEGWVMQIGDALHDQLSEFGVSMKGGKGVDVLDASDLPIPVYGKVVILGRGGDDILTGSLGDDTIRGGTGDDFIFDASGSNILKGGAGNDRIEIGSDSTGSKAGGGAGDDLLISGLGDDILIGGQGNDRLIGGGGNDILRGGPGDDVFMFNNTDQGHDLFRDFRDGEDLIELQGIAGFEELTLVQDGNNVVIGWGDADASITLKNADIDWFDASDFLFV